VTASGGIGVAAEHTAARDRDTGNRKRSFYLEGGPYETGLHAGTFGRDGNLGYGGEFCRNVVFDFIGRNF
jgi:hypothetical protein